MFRIERSRLLAAITLGLLLVAPAVEAQLVRGFMSGTVTDATGAIITGVQVTLTNKATNISRQAVSNEVGFYRFAAIEPGVYSVQFELAGFQTVKTDDITVSTAQEVVVNKVMALAAISVDVSVEATPGVELAKTTATIERTLPAAIVSEIPTTANDRDVTRLALTAPTVSRAPGSNEFSANGQRARNNDFIVDGVNNNDATVTLSSARIVPEAIQEIQIQTSAYQAEFGRNSGAQFSVVTKSGTNTYHGEAWDYYRGNWMEPLSLTNKRAGITATPRFVQNQFGGDLGGPIVKGRTFFFGLAEWNRRREAADTRNASSAVIPTPAGYAALANVPLRAGQSTASRQAVMSALSFLPDIQSQIRNYSNVKNVTINGSPIEVGTIIIPLANPFNYVNNIARVDHRLTNRDNLTYRFLLDKRYQPDFTDNRQFGSKWTADQKMFVQNHALSETHIFSGRLLNESRLAYVRANFDSAERDPVSSTVNINSFFTIGGLNTFPQGRLEQNYQLQDVATYTANRNSFKFGVDLRRTTLLNIATFDQKGTWTFNGLTDFVNNNAATLVQAITQASFDAKQWNTAFFFQDDLKATRDLTFNLGVRYEYSTVPLGFFGATDPVIQAAIVPGPAKPDKNNWAPRFGFAYSPSAPSGTLGRLLGDGKTSIRGGFGMGYDVLFLNILAAVARNYPRIVSSNTTNPVDLFPQLAPKVTTLPALNSSTNFANTTEDIQNPTTAFWSLSVQRELGNGYIVEAGYSGNRSYHQIRQGQANPPILTPEQAATVIAGGSIPSAQARRLNPNWGNRTIVESSAKAAYDAGYLKFDKRLSHGLILGANYTYSATFSDNDEPLNDPAITPSSPPYPQDYFNYRKEWSRSIFDRPHRFAVHYAYDIPAFSDGPAPLRRIFSGWRISGFTEFQSGQPFTILTGVDTTGTAISTTFRPGRPDLLPGGTMTKDPDTGDLRTFTAANMFFAPRNADGNILDNSMPGGGNLGRNTFRGPSFVNWNFSATKQIALAENWRMQIRGDFVNLWNHNNFGNPETRMNSPAFGTNSGTLLTDSRQMLLSAKIQF